MKVYLTYMYNVNCIFVNNFSGILNTVMHHINGKQYIYNMRRYVIIDSFGISE